MAPTQKLLLGSRRFSKVWYVIHSIPEQATEGLPAFVLSSEEQMPRGKTCGDLQGQCLGDSGERSSLAEQHQPGCRADRQEASNSSVAWRVLGKEPQHHTVPSGVWDPCTQREQPGSIQVLFPAGSKGASPQALIDNIPIALCTGALNEFPSWSRHLRAILIFRQEWKGCDLPGNVHPRLRSRA